MSKANRHNSYMLDNEKELIIPDDFRRISHMAIEVGSRVMDLVEKPAMEHFYVRKNEDSVFTIYHLAQRTDMSGWLLGIREIQSDVYAIRYHPSENEDILKAK